MQLQLASASGHILHHAAAAIPAPDHGGSESCCSNHSTPPSESHCPARGDPDRHDCGDCLICDATNDQVVLTGGQLRLLEIAGTAAAAAISYETDLVPAAKSPPFSLPPPAPQVLHSIALPLLN
jgi:hypothetical protein